MAVRTRAELDELIVQCEAKAAEACRNHDRIAEWEQEAVLWSLYDERADLPEQRLP